MAAGTWKIYASAKKYIGNGTITLGAGVFKMQLHRASASANILHLSTISTNASGSVPGQLSTLGGYTSNGKNLVPATAQWVAGTSTKQMKFTYTTIGLVVTGTLNNVKYALIRNSTGSGAGKLLCFCTLSASAFTIASGNTLTISPAATGVFTLA
jgi:hypothetical protein